MTDRTTVMTMTLVLSFFAVPVVDGHGRLIDPPARGSAWRFGFNTPINYNDNEMSCGGLNVMFHFLFTKIDNVLTRWHRLHIIIITTTTTSTITVTWRPWSNFICCYCSRLSCYCSASSSWIWMNHLSSQLISPRFNFHSRDIHQQTSQRRGKEVNNADVRIVYGPVKASASGRDSNCVQAWPHDYDLFLFVHSNVCRHTSRKLVESSPRVCEMAHDCSNRVENSSTAKLHYLLNETLSYVGFFCFCFFLVR